MITRLFPQQSRNFKGGFTLFYIMCGLVFGFLVSGCDGESETNGPAGPAGELAFQVQWETTGASTSVTHEGDNSAQLMAMECEDNGIFWVHAIVYDGNNEYVTESELWHCGAHGGTIPYVPVGSKRKVVIFGENAEYEVLYRGEVGNITVSANGVKNIGLIKAPYFVPTEGVYSIESEIFSWKAVTGARSYQLQVSRNIGFTDIEVDRTIDRATSLATPNIFSYENTHYWRIRSIDFDKYVSAWSHIWHFGAPPEEQVGPVVWSTIPNGGESNVSQDITLVTVIFNKPMHILEGNIEVFSWEYVGAGNDWVPYPFEITRSWDNTGQRLFIYGSFTGNQWRVLFRLSGFMDPDGNLLYPDPFEFEFELQGE